MENDEAERKEAAGHRVKAHYRGPRVIGITGRAGAVTRRSPTVLVDVDGVLADFNGGCLPLLRHLLHDSSLQRRDFPEWELTSRLSPGQRKVFYRHISGRGWCRDLKVLPQGREMVSRLRAQGFRAVYVTAPLRSSTHWLTDRAQWLMDHGFLQEGVRVEDQLRFTAQKWEVPGDLLVDDRWSNVRKFLDHRLAAGRTWATGALYGTHHNRREWGEVLDPAICLQATILPCGVETDPTLESSEEADKQWGALQPYLRRLRDAPV